MIVDGVDHVAPAGDTVMGRIGVAEIVERHVLEFGPSLLEAAERLQTLAPVEIRVRQDVPPPDGPPARTLKYVSSCGWIPTTAAA